MKQTLQLNLGQQLQLNPQLQQSMKLLQLSHANLQQEIQYQLDTNPLLCLEGSGETLTRKEIEAHNISFTSRSHYSNIQALAESAKDKQTLADRLEFQLELSQLTQRDKAIGYCIIENLNEAGYLKAQYHELQTQLNGLFEDPIDNQEIETLIHYIQQLQPMGCASRNLKEFLALQLANQAKDLSQADSNGYANTMLAQQMVDQHFELLVKHQYSKLAKKLKVLPQQVSQAQAMIMNLRKQPNYQNIDSVIDYVQPDVEVFKQDDLWQFTLLDNDLPSLAINRQYSESLHQSKNSNDKHFLKQYLPKAKVFLKNLLNRKNTLQQVAEFIIEHQQAYFEHGATALKPLRLHDIAQSLGLHESTVSRTVQNKFIQTPHGVIEFKSLFSNSIKSPGGEWSSTAIKSKIKSLIETEPSRKPLTDSTIARLLKSEGIQIARRTIAKYREALNIPSSSQRKLLNNI